MTEDQISVQEEDGSTMFCANLTLTPGYTLETTIIAPFTLDNGNTGWILLQQLDRI